MRKLTEQQKGFVRSVRNGRSVVDAVKLNYYTEREANARTIGSRLMRDERIKLALGDSQPAPERIKPEMTPAQLEEAILREVFRLEGKPDNFVDVMIADGRFSFKPSYEEVQANSQHF